MIIMVIDEFRQAGSSLEDDALGDANRVLPFNSVDAALHFLHLMLNSRADIPAFQLIVMGLSGRGRPESIYSHAIERLSTFFTACNRDLPQLLLVLDGSIPQDLILLASDIGAMITQRRDDDVHRIVQGGSPPADKSSRIRPLALVAYHT